MRLHSGRSTSRYQVIIKFLSQRTSTSTHQADNRSKTNLEVSIAGKINTGLPPSRITALSRFPNGFAFAKEKDGYFRSENLSST